MTTQCSADDSDSGINLETASVEDPREQQSVGDFDVIDLVNNLQDKLNACGHYLNVSLPQIVVIGSQSSGKSSTLESFVRKEFLPRGTGLVTRRPIVVQLIPYTDEFGIFLHKPDEKFINFLEIRNEIVRATEEECGSSGFSSNPISLKIYSPNVLKLTVVDLPGIIKVAVEDQPEEDIETVRKMVLEYIMEPNCIILAVTPAGQDISSSDALALAKIADPERERTVGVLTKIDLMDEGTNARNILENSEIKLKRGWVGVINRNQKEVQEGKDMNYILRKEREWFRRSEHYRHMAHRMGSPYLQKLLQKILRAHIKQCLPSLRIDISQRLFCMKKELKEIENIMGSGPNARENYMITLIQKFNSDVNLKLLGYSELVPVSQISYGAHINYKFFAEIPELISQTLTPDDGKLSVIMANLNGIRNPIAFPNLAIDAMCRNLIECFKEPMDSSVDCIAQILLSGVTESASVIDNYPSLKNEVLYQVRRWIEEESENTRERLRMHVDAEMFYVNIGHPDFDASVCNPVAPAAGSIKIWESKIKNASSDKDEADTLAKNLQGYEHVQKLVNYAKEIIQNYLEIVQKNALDITIKYIAYFLLKRILDRMNNDLITTMLNFTNKKSLNEDYENDYRRKEELERSCNSLSDALNAIKNF